MHLASNQRLFFLALRLKMRAKKPFFAGFANGVRFWGGFDQDALTVTTGVEPVAVVVVAAGAISTPVACTLGMGRGVAAFLGVATVCAACLRGRPGLRLSAGAEAGWAFLATAFFAPAFFGAALVAAAFLAVVFLFLLFLEVVIMGNIARPNAAMAEVCARLV